MEGSFYSETAPVGTGAGPRRLTQKSAGEQEGSLVRIRGMIVRQRPEESRHQAGVTKPNPAGPPRPSQDQKPAEGMGLCLQGGFPGGWLLPPPSPSCSVCSPPSVSPSLRPSVPPSLHLSISPSLHLRVSQPAETPIPVSEPASGPNPTGALGKAQPQPPLCWQS